MSTENDLSLLALLEPLLADPAVSEVMVDGYARVYVEKKGRFHDVPTPFRSDEHLRQAIQAAAAALGTRVDEANPLLDIRLSDDLRMNAVLPPVSLVGPALTVRRFYPTVLTVEDLLRFGSWNEDMVAFLRACVQARLNMVIAGGPASGKTTVLNIVAGMIPAEERIVVVQEFAELKLSARYLVTLESRPPDLNGRGAVTVCDLVRNALRMRPDRIVFAEAYPGQVRGGEALLELIYAINNGHDGTMVSTHSLGVRDALDRLEMMAALANPSLPLLNLRREIAAAINLVVYQERLRDGTRRLVKIAEVVGMQGDAIMTQDLFEFRQTGFQEGRVAGRFTATGNVPKCLDRLRAAVVDLPVSLFTPA